MNDLKVNTHHLVVAIMIATLCHFLFSLSLEQGTPEWIIFIYSNIKTPSWVILLGLGFSWSKMNINLRAGFHIWSIIGAFIGIVVALFLKMDSSLAIFTITFLSYFTGGGIGITLSKGGE